MRESDTCVAVLVTVLKEMKGRKEFKSKGKKNIRVVEVHVSITTHGGMWWKRLRAGKKDEMTSNIGVKEHRR